MRLGTSFGNRAYVLDRRGRKLAGPLESSGGAVLVTQISPDGGQVATIETVVETVGGPPRPIPYLFLARAVGGGRDTVARSVVSAGWLGDRLLRDDPAGSAPFEDQLCVLATNTDFACERLVAADPGLDLRDPAVSPDGTLVAATRAPGQIAVYDVATARLVRMVSSGPDDSAPTWSPDGRRIAFARGDGGLWVAPAGGPPGSAHRILASGSQPAWVRAGGPLRLSGPRRAGAGARVRIRLANAPPGARARLQRRRGGWRTLTTRRARGGRVAFSVRLTRGRGAARAGPRTRWADTVSRRFALTVR